MILTLSEDIISYLEYLRSQNLFITIHYATSAFANCSHIIKKFNIHYNPYCLIVKSSDEAWQHCVDRQTKICEKLKDGTFYGMCYAGVEEYIIPIAPVKMIGFISVSGYGTDFQKALPRIAKVAADYHLSKERLEWAYQKNMIKGKPSMEEVCAIIKPLCHMLNYLYDKVKTAPVAGSTYYSAAIAYINRNFTKNISLADISTHCGCSKSSLSHIFKKSNGAGINTYINQLRVHEAKILLKNSNFSIQEISSMVGYEDSNYFSNVFKSECAIPPSEFRKRCHIGK